MAHNVLAPRTSKAGIIGMACLVCVAAVEARAQTAGETRSDASRGPGNVPLGAASLHWLSPSPSPVSRAALYEPALGPARSKTFEPSIVTRQQGEGLAQWKAKVDAAQKRRRSGVTYVLVGTGVAVASSVLGVATASLPVYLIGGLGGSALMIYGGVTWISANDQIDELDREGRMKGYLSQTGGAQWRVALSIRL